ncbi:histidine phosphotransferase [Aquicoccus sp. SCR17]|nr:histidine phosphotransferase [Carideicomes alvinocaridis]
MGEPNVNIAALIGSRICHDLISPIGAINNGLELLEMSGAREGPEMALISESCADATARIRFFRVAFGAAPEGRDIGSGELRDIIAPLVRPGRHRIDWRPEEPLSRAEAQIGFLALLCAESALPRGGEIVIDRVADRWVVRASGDDISTECRGWLAMEHPGMAADLPPARVQFLLLPQVAAALGRQVEVRRDDTWLELKI